MHISFYFHPRNLTEAPCSMMIGIKMKLKHTEQKKKGKSPLLPCLQVFHLLQVFQVRPM